GLNMIPGSSHFTLDHPLMAMVSFGNVTRALEEPTLSTVAIATTSPISASIAILIRWRISFGRKVALNCFVQFNLFSGLSRLPIRVGLGMPQRFASGPPQERGGNGQHNRKYRYPSAGIV